LQELKHLLIASREATGEIVPLHIERDLTVPAELSEKFANELWNRMRTTTSEADNTSYTSQLSVQDGLEAFFSHFKEVRHKAIWRDFNNTFRPHKEVILCHIFGS
jgi:hypothetical protein